MTVSGLDCLIAPEPACAVGSGGGGGGGGGGMLTPSKACMTIPLSCIDSTSTVIQEKKTARSYIALV